MMLSWVRYQWSSLWLLVSAFGSLLLFLYGFFPINYHAGHIANWNDLPTKIDSVIIDGQEIYNPGEMSVIMMVIDGLRYDFVTEEYMPYTVELLINKTGCIQIAVAEPPTVTMPRIKAMMTGSVSTFADVALNFGAPAVRGDSVIRAAHSRGRHQVMYGDDTWLRLFPGLWDESDGTTSFYVTDYTEVDTNVTRHLDEILKPKEDKSPKFDFLVLHYLGLDHIGHLEGARSPKIKPKLLEMDGIVKKIFTDMQKWNRNGVLVICGDHGMRDAGGHGGSTPAELLVPLVNIHSQLGFKCSHDQLESPVVSQTDLAPTLAWWLRVQIPGDSLGRVLKSALPEETLSSLYVLHYNALQNSKGLIATLGEKDAVEKECYKQFKRAEKYFAQYINTKQQSAAKMAKEFYEESLREMAEYLSTSNVEFDMFAIVLGTVLVFMIFLSVVLITLHSFSFQMDNNSTSVYKKISLPVKIVTFFILTSFFGAILTFYCAIAESSSCLCSLKPLWLSIMSVISLTLATNYSVVKAGIENIPNLDLLKEINSIDLLLISGTVIHSLTFVGTSFIEEEHQTWYFLWNTLMFFVLLRTFGVLLSYFTKKLDGATEVQDKPSLLAKMSSVGLDMMPKWIMLICLHRFLRTLNQTGDRWAFLPDTADWLNEPQNYPYLLTLMMSGKIITLLICLHNLKNTKNAYHIQTILTIAAFTCILLYRITTGAILNTLGLKLDEIKLVEIFWVIIFLKIVVECISFVKDYSKCVKVVYVTEDSNGFYLNVAGQKDLFKKEKNEDFLYEKDAYIDKEPSDVVKLNLVKSLSYLVLNNMMLIVILLMRTCNVILVPSIYFSCFLTTRCIECSVENKVKTKERVILDVFSTTLVHFWLGYIFYFYQGNSNSLSSVDLSAGYVGLREYSAWRVAIRMGLHTYAAPALAGMMLFANIAKADRWHSYKKSVKICTSTLSLVRIYALVTYLCVVTGFRHHLFVWTVFSPKLLYDFVATAFSIAALLTIFYIIQLASIVKYLVRF